MRTETAFHASFVLAANQNGEAAPAPVAVDLAKTSVAHPSELRADFRQDVLGVAPRPPDSPVEFLVQFGSCAGDDFQIGEHATWPQSLHDLAEQRTLSSMWEMMDSKAGHHNIEDPKGREWSRQVMLVDLDALVSGESLESPSNHWC